MSSQNCIDVAIGVRRHGRIAAAEMQRAGAGDRDLRQRLGARAQEREIRRVDRAFPRDAAFDRRHRLRAASARRVLGRRLERDVAKLAVEIAVIGRAAEFAVGRKPQADALLQAHRVLDGAVFGCRQRRLIDLAAREAPPRIEQCRRPQQAADMLGAKREG